MIDQAARIKALDVSVVNKIAAGEIIIAPVNALKEMMENSIDAGATNVDILVREGGIKLLQVTDNGCGINKQDLDILCERFTTSKLSSFEDLRSIQTYGFRGEALASLSHISRVSVTTKTRDSPCAWKANYVEGKLAGKIQPCAGKDGTTIQVQDLFYNMQSRLRSLRSGSEELAKIVECVGRYAIHTRGVGFSCKKFGDPQFALIVSPELEAKERIRAIYGGSIASNLIELKVPNLEEFGVTALGQVSNLNFNNKKSYSFIFFINNRLVTCEPLRRSLAQVYSTYLPKTSRPYVYLSLNIRPDLVDVNVHPTKREVRFLHDEEIINHIANSLQETLSSVDTSRAFRTTSIYTEKPSNTAMDKGIPPASSFHKPPMTLAGDRAKVRENKLVRIDASQAKITSYLPSVENGIDFSQSQRACQSKKRHIEAVDEEDSASDLKSGITSSSQFGNIPSTYQHTGRTRTVVNLLSIKQLRKRVDDNTDRELTSVFANLTYIGLVDAQRRLASIQFDLKLLLVDYGSLCYHLFYQIGLSDFANFGRITICSDENSEGLKIYDLLSVMPDIQEDAKLRSLKNLWEMREMLGEYFCIEISNGDDDLKNCTIETLPLLLKDYDPPLSKLSIFLYKVAMKTDWSNEICCLDDVLRQIALFYIPEVIEFIETANDDKDVDLQATYASKIERISQCLEHVIFPCIKKRLLASKDLKYDVAEIANLPGLYRVFERC